MAQGFYSLDEAAQRLGMPAEELSGMAQRREVRAFADRGTWRFRVQDVEELARQRGVPSDPSMPSVAFDSGEERGSGTEEIAPFEIQDLTEVMTPPAEEEDIGVDLFASSVDDARRKTEGDSGVFLGPKSDVAFKTAPLSDPGGSGSAILGGPKSGPFGKQPSSGIKPPSSKPGKQSGVQPPAAQAPVSEDENDSIVPIGMESLGTPGMGDSSVRLDGLSGRLPDSGVRLVDFDDLPGLSGLVAPPSSTRLSPGSKPPTVRSQPEVVSKVPPSTPELPPLSSEARTAKPGSSADFDFGTSAEFDLSPASGQSPSDSVFDLSTPSMDSIELQITSDLEDTGNSAIDLERPQISPGRSGRTARDKVQDADSSDDSVTFELSMEEDLPAKRSGRHQPINSSFELSLESEALPQAASEDSSSDFELTLDDAGSSEMVVEDQTPSGAATDDLESSDFELALDDDSISEIVDDTGSEVVVLEDDAAVAAATEDTPAESIAELDEVGDADLVVVEPATEDAATTRIAKDAVPLPADWGWTSLLLIPTTLVLLFTGFLMFEMVRSVWSYEEPSKVAAPVYHLMKGFTK